MTQLMFLIGCEESGAVRDARLRRGHFAMSCDLLPSSAATNRHLHIHGDIIPMLNLGWDAMICFPPCTYLCGSGMHWNDRPGHERFGGHQTEDALNFVQLLLGAPIGHIGLENPVGCISTRIRPADQYIQPYEFGDDASKKTGLWLKNLPPLVVDPIQRFSGRIVEWPRGSGKMVERWSNQTDSGQNKLGPSDDRGILRSKTYPGIADAMADQWIAHILARRALERKAA